MLLVITRLELGGAQRVVLHTVRKLDREVFEVALAWGPGERLDPEAEAIEDLQLFPVSTLVRPIAPVSDLRAVHDLRRIMRSFRPDVVHTHSSKAGILGRFAARRERVPAVIHTVHGFGFTPLQPPPMRFAFLSVEKMLARWTDHFITVSESDRRRGIELGLFPAERSTVIRAGIDLGAFREASGGSGVRERLGIPSAAPLVTQVGNFKPQKAPLDFVRVAAEVAIQCPDAWFVMVGDGPLRPAAEELAKSLAVADRMVFCGWWDDVPALLDATTVSVLTSIHEGLPCSVVEAVAAGVPVVATAVDGTVEVIRSGVNGFLAPVGNIGALSAAVSGVLGDSAMRERMAAEEQEELDQFDRDVMVRQQEDLYRCLGPTNRL